MATKLTKASRNEKRRKDKLGTERSKKKLFFGVENAINQNEACFGRKKVV